MTTRVLCFRLFIQPENTGNIWGKSDKTASKELHTLHTLHYTSVLNTLEARWYMTKFKSHHSTQNAESDRYEIIIKLEIHKLIVRRWYSSWYKVIHGIRRGKRQKRRSGRPRKLFQMWWELYWIIDPSWNSSTSRSRRALLYFSFISHRAMYPQTWI